MKLSWVCAYGITVSALQLLGEVQERPWHSESGYRWRSLELPSGGHSGFSSVDPATSGLRFTNVLSAERSLTNQIYLNGSGVAAGDVDGDGRCDLYFCGLDRGNALFRNLGGWRFEDISASAGVRCVGMDSTGATFADVDGDGDLDLLVNTVGHGTRCLLNDGHGHFTDVTDTVGLSSSSGSTSLALADVDGDGFLDLYVVNYRRDTLRDHPNTRFRIQMVDGKPMVALVDGRPVTEPDLQGRYSVGATGGILEHGEVSVLYQNRGGTHFSPVPFTGGAFLDEMGKPLTWTPHDWGLSVMLRDLNGDGLPDIYACNDFDSPDRIWLNQGSGRFRAIARSAVRHTSLYSMGVDVADVNRDGNDDLFVADMLSMQHARRMVQLGDPQANAGGGDGAEDRPQYKMNTLFLNRGDGTYAEIARFSGVAASEWSWNPTFLDVDLDGYEDLLITNGHERDAQNIDIGTRLEAMRRSGKFSPREILESRRQFPALATANLAFRNRGDLTFEEVGAAWGFDQVGVSQGMACADLDGDGDLDVIINNLNAPPTVLRNETVAPRLAVRLKGLPPNTCGVGARIRVVGGPVPQSQEMICGGRYLSGDDFIRVFAAGFVTSKLSVEVNWRSGRKSVVMGVQANSLLEVSEPETAPVPPAAAGPPPTWFRDSSASLDHIHVDELFDDFQRQPLLPERLSQLGPGVAWGDLNGDGLDDLVVGTGKGGSLAIWMNQGDGKWMRRADPRLDAPAPCDSTGLVISPDGRGGAHLAVGFSNAEDGDTRRPAVIVLPFGAAQNEASLPGGPASTGPLALADVDGDGELDLFVGGRSIPGQFPRPASSSLWHGEKGRWIPDAKSAPLLTHLGLVSGAVFSDLNGDGWPDLILACQWGPIRILINHLGTFSDETQAMGLAGLTGWWSGVATGDFDGDGQPDIVASNVGLNTLSRATLDHPRRLYWGELSGSGSPDLIEAIYDPLSGREVVERDLRALSAAIPGLRDRFPTYAAFAAATSREVLGPDFSRCAVLEGTVAESVLLLNRGNHFEMRRLPSEAQFSPGFAPVVADFDGDGHQDLFLSQNFFGTRAGVPRGDAGVGLLLQGDGHGVLRGVSVIESGIEVHGEQRGAAVADYDGDGRPDLVVTQNRGATRLFHNERAAPALRVRLQGGPGNPSGVGAAIRGIYPSGPGPILEVQVGGGYWSQNSLVQLISQPEKAVQLWVRWPGGTVTVVPVPSASQEIEVDVQGKARRIR